jgi:hypothetical protein
VIILQKIVDKLINFSATKDPSFVVGGHVDPYLYRWYLIPRNKFLNIYLHKFLRSDDDRALHDHPWVNASFLLRGEYTEHTIKAGGIHFRELLSEGDFRIRWSGKMAHRVEVSKPCWTLFITGPAYREWGFHCPDQGWVSFKNFTDSTNTGITGKGCDA